jgi:outer membrane immunogenic protein
MRQFFLGSIALVALIVSPVLAADLPARPVYKAPPVVVAHSWTGWYVGANVGGHWGRDSFTVSADPIGWFVPAGNAFINSFFPTTLKPQGIIGGMQTGYNWQINSVLLGFEADANWLGGSTSRVLVNTVTGLIAMGDFMANSTNATFLSTVRARLGVTFDRALFYVTGGLAIGTIKTTDSFGFVSGTIVAATNNTTTRAGGTVGGGFEYAFTDNWSAKVEYLYVNLGSFDTSIPSCLGCNPGSDITVHRKYFDNIARVGLNYKFGGPVVAKY